MNNEQKIFLGKLSPKTEKLNELILSSVWSNLNFDENFFKNGFELNSYLINNEQKQFFDLFLELIPEWKKIIKRKQHLTHDYRLDIHTLQVVKKIQKSNDYQTFDNYEKLVLLYAAYLHDIDKNENEVDAEHPLKGADSSSKILYRLGFHEKFIADVYSIIKNHQLIGIIAAGKLNIDDNEILNTFKNKYILKLLITLTIADIKSVKRAEGWFYDDIKNNINGLKKRLI